MLNYYCNCTLDGSNKADKGKSPIREVEASTEGICLDCGHYAIATTVKVKTIKDLYKILRIDNG